MISPILVEGIQSLTFVSDHYRHRARTELILHQSYGGHGAACGTFGCPWKFGKVFHHRYLFICESQHLDQINHRSNTITDGRLLACDPLTDQFTHCQLTAKTEPIICQYHESHVATCEPLLQDSCVPSADCTGNLCQWMTIATFCGRLHEILFPAINISRFLPNTSHEYH